MVSRVSILVCGSKFGVNGTGCLVSYEVRKKSHGVFPTV